MCGSRVHQGFVGKGEVPQGTQQRTVPPVARIWELKSCHKTIKDLEIRAPARIVCRRSTSELGLTKDSKVLDLRDDSIGKESFYQFVQYASINQRVFAVSSVASDCCMCHLILL